MLSESHDAYCTLWMVAYNHGARVVVRGPEEPVPTQKRAGLSDRRGQVQKCGVALGSGGAGYGSAYNYDRGQVFFYQQRCSMPTDNAMLYEIGRAALA